MSKPERVKRRGKTLWFDPSDLPFDPLPKDENARFWRQQFSGGWEEDTLRLLDDLVTPESTFVDVGAWFGPLTLYAALLARKVIALEPDPVAYQVLLRNLAANPWADNVTALDAALGLSDGTMLIGGNGPLGNSESTLLVNCAGYKDQVGAVLRTGDRDAEKAWRGSPAVPVRTVSIESLFEHCAVTSCSLVKLDIEGGEKLLVPALAPFLSDRKIPLLVSLHWPYLDESELVLVLQCLFKHFDRVCDLMMNPIDSPGEVLGRMCHSVLGFSHSQAAVRS